MKPVPSILLALFLIAGCIQFKVDVLKPDLLSKIPIGQEPEKINAEIVNSVLTNLPIQIPHRSGVFYVVDNVSQAIKSFDNQGNLDFVIGNTEREYPSNVNLFKYKFGNIGLVSIDDNGNLYVQNRFGKKEDLTLIPKEEDIYKKYSGMFDPTPSSPLPSYIVKMTRKGVASSILGVRGKNTEPFRIIESMWATTGERLFVYHKLAEEMRLTYIKEDSLVGEIMESRLDIYKDPTYKDFKILVDRMMPHPEGDYALVSVSFTNKSDNRFKYRRLFRVDFKSPTSTTLIKEIQDPSEHLFTILDNNEFYIWETEDGGNSIRLQVHNEEGNHINNKRLPIDPPRGQWREIYTDGGDGIYAIRIRSGSVELYRWR